MESRTRREFGIIHIGSVRISLQIISCSGMDDFQILENVSKESGYGEEVFLTHIISFESLNELCRILLGFRQLLRDYNIQDISVVATTAIREAANSLNIVDQIHIRTGFQVQIIDMTKEVYYKYFAIYYRVSKGEIDFAGMPVLLMDITSGGLGLTLWQAGTLLFQQNVPSGTLRILENFEKRQREELTFPTAVREYIHGMLSPIWGIIKTYNVKYVVLSGMESWSIVKAMGMTPRNNNCLVQPDTFFEFYHSFNGVTPYKLMQRYGYSENRANIIMPTILLYYEMLRYIQVDTLVFLDTTFVEGYSLYYGAEKENASYLVKQRRLILQLAHTLAGKYLCDRPHAERVEEHGIILFQALHRIHGLEYHTGYLLRMAAIFHEAGKYINLHNPAVYTYYLIMGTDIFGLSNEEKEIVANIAYYYNGGTPGDDDMNYRSLTRSQKVTVAKLTAIFRLADALDQGHNGKISKISATLQKRELIVKYISDEDISLERWTFSKASRYFTEVFGINPVLQKG
jgi:exopolyphosphatase/guanosine-5'-triphosphate,3'-diphosphate pyrophosphatase